MGHANRIRSKGPATRGANVQWETSLVIGELLSRVAVRHRVDGRSLKLQRCVVIYFTKTRETTSIDCSHLIDNINI